MFGWEFPPFSSGGLGTACHGLTKGLSKKGVEVIFVLPKGTKKKRHKHARLLLASSIKRVTFRLIDSIIMPYLTPRGYVSERLQECDETCDVKLYGKNLFEEVMRYAEKAKLIASNESFDIIHAHDWMTYPAGIAAKRVSKKPLVVHVHATEFDRTGDNPNPQVYEIERQGMQEAEMIIAVSSYTKQKIVQHYNIPAEKIRVVYNAIEKSRIPEFRRGISQKVVLFLGRITLQKGPDYFLEAAKLVLEKDPDVRFIIVGKGDMEAHIIEKAAQLGIGDKVLFAGFLEPREVHKAYQTADLYVMPSVSEPFGIAALEALQSKTPVLISKNAGVGEVLKHCLRVDFWDVQQMANKILAVLSYTALKESLSEHGYAELSKFSWEDSAEKCIAVYNEAIEKHESPLQW